MLIKEYRIVMPLTVEEYQVAQLHCVAEASKQNTGGGEGIEVLKNEPYDNYPLLNGMFTKGQYTYKIYHLASKVPAFIRLLAPKGALEIHEQAWNAYPYCKTVLSVHQLDPETLKQREVVPIDIAADPVDSRDYCVEYDPALYYSVKSGRGPLKPNWMKMVFCSLDLWYGMTMVQIRELEEETRKQLEEQLTKGAVKGFSAD